MAGLTEAQVVDALSTSLESLGFDYLDRGESREVYLHPGLQVVLKLGRIGNLYEIDTWTELAEDGMDSFAAPLIWHSPSCALLLQAYVPDTHQTTLSRQESAVIAQTLAGLGFHDCHELNVGLLQGRPVIFDIEAGYGFRRPA